MNRSPGRSPRGCIGTLCGRAGRLADDPIHKLLLGRDPSDGGRLASQPTISGFEHTAAPHLRQILLPRLWSHAHALLGHTRWGHTIYGAAMLPPVTITMARYGPFHVACDGRMIA